MGINARLVLPHQSQLILRKKKLLRVFLSDYVSHISLLHTMVVSIRLHDSPAVPKLFLLEAPFKNVSILAAP